MSYTRFSVLQVRKGRPRGQKPRASGAKVAGEDDPRGLHRGKAVLEGPEGAPRPSPFSVCVGGEGVGVGWVTGL